MLEAIDGVPMDDFARGARPFLDPSDPYSADARLFHHPHLFPAAFTFTLGGGEEVRIDRRGQVSAAASGPAETTGRWLVDGQVAVHPHSGVLAAALRAARAGHYDARTQLCNGWRSRGSSPSPAGRA